MKEKIKTIYILGIRIGFLRAIYYIFVKKNKINSPIDKTQGFSEIKHPNYKFTFYLRPNTSDFSIFNEIVNNQEYKIVKKINPQIILDLGGNIGITSVYFANQYPNAKIFCIEPESGNFELLEKNTSYYPNIIGINCAIWSEKKELYIENSTGWDVKVSENISGSNIEAKSITDIMKTYSLEKIDILKMDIEGCEAEIFSKNYESWLPNVKILIIELHNMIDPQVSKIFFNTISKYNFQISYSGENLFCINNNS